VVSSPGRATALPVSVETPSPRGEVTLAAAVMVAVSLPAFAVGALAPLIDADMAFGAAEVGLTMAGCFTLAGVLSPLGGRLVARIGAPWAARIVSVLCTLGLVGVSLAQEVWQVATALLLVGAANAVSQPTSNHLLARLQEPRRRALAFGVVQAAIPAASLAAGAALAVTSRGREWRVTMLVAAGCTLAIQAVVPRQTTGTAVPPAARAPAPVPAAAGPRARLAPLVLTGALGSAAATALPTFVATAGLAQGLSAFTVAGAQIVGSTGSVVVRIAAPVLVSHAPARRRFTLMAGLIAAGSTGLLLLVTGTPVAFVCGSVLGFAFGWGWNGLYNQLVASAAPDRVAAATGATQAGVFLGGTAGPVLFAAVAATAGFSAAWAAMAALMCLAAVSTLTAGAHHRTAPAPHPTVEGT
jgi:MFS family permease